MPEYTNARIDPCCVADHSCIRAFDNSCLVRTVERGSWLVVLALLGACSSPPRQESHVPPPVAMDSAQIYRLCVKPALVHAGLTDCELKDQSSPRIPALKQP